MITEKKFSTIIVEVCALTYFEIKGYYAHVDDVFVMIRTNFE